MTEGEPKERKDLWQRLGGSIYWILILFYGFLLMIVVLISGILPDFEMDFLAWIDSYYEWVILPEVRDHYPVEGPFPERALGQVERYAGTVRDIGYYQAFQIHDGLVHCGEPGIGAVAPARDGWEVKPGAEACHYDYSGSDGSFIRYRFTENSLQIYYLTDD